MSFLTPEILCLFMFITAIGLLLAGFPVAFTLSGTAAIFALAGSYFGLFDLTLLTAFPQRVFGTMNSEVLVAVPLFVFMGVMLERSRVAEELLDNMGKAFGTLPGGLGYSVCLVGALLAASTGIVGATVVTMGLLSLPIMLKRGYSKPLACGTIAASGTLGQIIPPSIVLVLLGSQLSIAYQNAQFAMGSFSPDTVSVNDLFAGALIPGLALVGMYVLYQIVHSLLRPGDAPPIPREDMNEEERRKFRKHLLKALFAPIILIITVLGSILGGLATPTEAAAVGAVGAMMLAGHRIDERRGWPILLGALCLAGLLILTHFIDLRMQRDSVSFLEKGGFVLAILMTGGLVWGVLAAAWRTWRQTEPGASINMLASVMRSTMEISSMVFIILVGASLFSLTFRGFNGDVWVEDFLHNLPGGTLSAMLLVMGVMFIMGFFLDFLEIIFIVVPIVAPILLQMEIAPGVTMSPVWLGVMMGLNLQTSFLTPPFGFALFYLRGVAPPEVHTTDIYKGIVPFVAIQVLALVMLWFFPAIATWLPTAIYGP